MILREATVNVYGEAFNSYLEDLWKKVEIAKTRSFSDIASDFVEVAKRSKPEQSFDFKGKVWMLLFKDPDNLNSLGERKE
jgi:hypothetical protein